MQFGRATFVQPNLPFSTESNYSIMMETMEIFIKTNWHLICRHGRGILFQFLVLLCCGVITSRYCSRLLQGVLYQ